MSFLEQLKKEEEDEGTAAKNEVTYSYQLKDEKKITSTPLIEYLAAKNQEKLDSKVRKLLNFKNNVPDKFFIVAQES